MLGENLLLGFACREFFEDQLDRDPSPPDDRFPHKDRGVDNNMLFQSLQVFCVERFCTDWKRGDPPIELTP